MDEKSEQGWVRKQDKLQTDRGTKRDSEFSTLQGRPCQCVAEAGARTSGLGPHGRGWLCQRLRQAINTMVRSQCPVCLVLGCQLANLPVSTGLTGVWSYLIVPN